MVLSIAAILNAWGPRKSGFPAISNIDPLQDELSMGRGGSETTQRREPVPVEGFIPQRELKRPGSLEVEARVTFVRHPDPAVHLESFATD